MTPFVVGAYASLPEAKMQPDYYRLLRLKIGSVASKFHIQEMSQNMLPGFVDRFLLTGTSTP